MGHLVSFAPLMFGKTWIIFFFQCNFFVRVWNYLRICWQVGDVMRQFLCMPKGLNKPFFVEVVFLACWNIWISRNARILRNERPTFYRWRSHFVLWMKSPYWPIGLSLGIGTISWEGLHTSLFSFCCAFSPFTYCTLCCDGIKLQGSGGFAL